MIKCFNETYNTFNEEYYNIKNNFHPINVNNSNNEIKYNYFNFPFNNGNTGNINYDIFINSQKSAFFSLDLEFEGIEENQPTITAKIINLSGPKDMQIEILSGTTDCEGIRKSLKVDFNEANYTMLVKYDTESTNINITNIVHIKDYNYNIKQYKRILVEKEENNMINVNGIEMDFSELDEGECKEENIDNENVKIEEKTNSSYVLI